MKRIGVFLMVAVLLAGCGKKEAPVIRVVTGIQVEYDRDGEVLYRTYSKSTSIQSVLTYLRILRPFGPTVPKGEFDTTCRIILEYSDGSKSMYLQQGDRYIRRDEGDWERIDNEQANLLYPLLLLLPSDA